MVEGVVEVKGSGLGEGSGFAMSWTLYCQRYRVEW